MAEKEIKWTLTAINDRIDILDYWIQRNKSKDFSIRLDTLIEQAVSQVSNYPESGKVSEFEDVRIKIVYHYLIFYQVQGETIHILRLWDSRRNPRELRL